MRFLALTLTLAAIPAMAAEYPLWNGEPVEEYAKRVGLPPTKTIDLGDGVAMEFVLIPAGTFTMGTQKPGPFDSSPYATQTWIGWVAFTVSLVVVVMLLALTIRRAIREKRRPQVSLAWLLVFVVVGSSAILSWLHWTHSAQTLAAAKWSHGTVMSVCSDTPAHDVTLTRPYYIGKYEVTQDQYQQAMGKNPSRFKGNLLPVEMVAWSDAQVFCSKVSSKVGLSVRMPTEAEWEHACRAGTTTTYHSGDTESALDHVGWYDENKDKGTAPVGKKESNPWGIHDMHGNVYEWCQDRREKYGNAAVVDPRCPPSGTHRTARGGAWTETREFCSSWFRMAVESNVKSNNIGFRVVLDIKNP